MWSSYKSLAKDSIRRTKDDSMLNKLHVSSQRTADFHSVNHRWFIYPIGEEVAVPFEILPREVACIRKYLNPSWRINVGHDQWKDSLMVS